MWFDFGIAGELHHPLSVNSINHWVEGAAIDHLRKPVEFPKNKVSTECLLWVRGVLVEPVTSTALIQEDEDIVIGTPTGKPTAITASRLASLLADSRANPRWGTQQARKIQTAFHPDKWLNAPPLWIKVALYFFDRASVMHHD